MQGAPYYAKALIPPADGTCYMDMLPVEVIMGPRWRRKIPADDTTGQEFEFGIGIITGIPDDDEGYYFFVKHYKRVQECLSPSLHFDYLLSMGHAVLVFPTRNFPGKWWSHRIAWFRGNLEPGVNKQYKAQNVYGLPADGTPPAFETRQGFHKRDGFRAYTRTTCEDGVQLVVDMFYR
jgi:hypothetical protein